MSGIGLDEQCANLYWIVQRETFLEMRNEPDLFEMTRQLYFISNEDQQ